MVVQYNVGNVVRPEYLKLAGQFMAAQAPSAAAVPPPSVPVTTAAAPIPSAKVTTPIAPPLVSNVTGTALTNLTTPAGVQPETVIETDYEPGKQYPSDSEGGTPDGSIPLGYQWAQNPVNSMWILEQDTTEGDEPAVDTYVPGPPSPRMIAQVRDALAAVGGDVSKLNPALQQWLTNSGVDPATLGAVAPTTAPAPIERGVGPRRLTVSSTGAGYTPTPEETAEIETQARTQLDAQIAAAPWYRRNRMQGNYQGMLNSIISQLKQSLVQTNNPNFKHGGEVPGPDDAPITITAHGGERVLTREQNQGLKGLNLDNMIEFARTPAGRVLLNRLGGCSR